MNNTTFEDPYKVINNWFINCCIALYAVVFALGFVGNLMTAVVVLLNKTMRRSIHFYTINLALADAILLLFYIPTQMKMVFDQLYWNMGETLCSISYFVISVCITATIGTLVAISIDRMRAVSNPFKWKADSQLLSKIIIPIIWLASIVIASPITYVAVVSKHPRYPGRLYCREDWSPNAGLTYWLTIMIIQYVIPLLLIASLHIIMVRKISQSGDTINILHRRMIRMIVLLLITYTVCTGMQHVVFVIAVLTQKDFIYAFVISNLVVSVQAAINPLIYGTSRNDFKEAFSGLLKRGVSMFGKGVFSSETRSNDLVAVVTPLMYRKVSQRKQIKYKDHLQVPGCESEESLEERKRNQSFRKRLDTMAYLFSTSKEELEQSRTNARVNSETGDLSDDDMSCTVSVNEQTISKKRVMSKPCLENSFENILQENDFGQLDEEMKDIFAIVESIQKHSEGCNNNKRLDFFYNDSLNKINLNELINRAKTRPESMLILLRESKESHI